MLSASVVDQEAALDAGARFFLRKPYRGEMLVQAIRTALETNDTRSSTADAKPIGAESHESPAGFNLGL